MARGAANRRADDLRRRQRAAYAEHARLCAGTLCVRGAGANVLAYGAAIGRRDEPGELPPDDGRDLGSEQGRARHVDVGDGPRRVEAAARDGRELVAIGAGLVPVVERAERVAKLEVHLPELGHAQAESDDEALRRGRRARFLHTVPTGLDESGALRRESRVSVLHLHPLPFAGLRGYGPCGLLTRTWRADSTGIAISRARTSVAECGNYWAHPRHVKTKSTTSPQTAAMKTIARPTRWLSVGTSRPVKRIASSVVRLKGCAMRMSRGDCPETSCSRKTQSSAGSL